MSLSPEEMELILKAQKHALEALNSQSEFIYPVQENLDIARSVLVKEGTPVSMWGNCSIWLAALVSAHADGLLVRRQTAAERAAELHSQDRHAGSRAALAEARRQQSQKSGKEEYEAAQAWARESLQALMEPKAAQKKKQEEQATAAAAFAAEQRAIISSLPVDKHFSEFSKEEKRLFMRLVPDSIRLFNRKQHEHQQKHFEETE